MKLVRRILSRHIKSYSSSGNGLIIGVPGVGKTYILKELCADIINRGEKCLYLPIDELGVDNYIDFQKELGIDIDFIEYLKNQINKDEFKKGQIIIDSFDSARSEKEQKFYLQLIKRIINECNDSWNILVSVRIYDAKKSDQLLDMFPKIKLDTIPNNYQYPGIKCRHFKIPELEEKDIISIKSDTNLIKAYKNSSEELKNVLTTPFNLELLEILLSEELDKCELSYVRSEVQLLDLYWRKRINNRDVGEELNLFLTRISRKMVENKELSARKEEFYYTNDGELLRYLLSTNILSENITQQKVKFSHNILFDYAISRLIMDEEPDKLLNFLKKDQSYPLFLHPSLTYFLTFLWYSERKAFWKVFWYLLKRKEINIRLFTRLLPTAVLVNEITNINEFNPLIEYLSISDSVAKESIKRLLQAYRTIGIKNKLLWSKFLDKLCYSLDKEYAWEIAFTATIILDKMHNENNKTYIKDIKVCISRIGRKLFKWIWNQRLNNNKEFDRLCSNLVVPLIAKTYEYSVTESNLLLNKALNLIKEANFPIEYIYQLSQYTINILPKDPKFVSKIYKSVFSHVETSEEKTDFGGIVISMTSNRRQDYEMCFYNLAEQFKDFLKAHTIIATQTLLEILDKFIKKEHNIVTKKNKIKSIKYDFSFLKGIAKYIPDYSYIWDQGYHTDKPIEMADTLFNYIEKLSENGDKDSITNILKKFRDKGRMAFVWRRILDVGSRKPEVFSNLLFELCIAKPIRIELETVTELGQFLEAAYRYYDTEQQYEIEESILSLNEIEIEEHLKDYLKRIMKSLISRIPPNLLHTEEGKSLYKKIEEAEKIQEKEPPVKFKSGVSTYSDKEYLKDLGADLQKSKNETLIKLFDPLDKFNKKWTNEVPNINDIHNIIPHIKELFEALQNSNDAEEPVKNMAWSHLSTSAYRINWGLDDPNSLEYQFCRELLLVSANSEYPKPDPSIDDKFDIAHWSHEPRNNAALGLPVLIVKNYDKEIIEAILRLSKDAVPMVRNIVAMELWRIYYNANDEFWNIASNLANYEKNSVVLNSLLRSLGKHIAKDEKKSVEILDKIVSKRLLNDDKDPYAPLSSLLAGLVLYKNNDWAIKKISDILTEPIRNAIAIRKIAFEFLKHIGPKELEDNILFFKTSNEWIQKCIRSSAIGISELIKQYKDNWTEETYELLKNVYSVINMIVSSLYFNSGLKKSDNNKEETISDTQKRRYYFDIKPILEQILEFALQKECGIIFANTAHFFMRLLNGMLKYDPPGVIHLANKLAEASQSYNYNLDELAVSEVVNIVEKILADFKKEVKEGDALTDLLGLLDIFTKTGNPRALRLVWKLDEIYR